MAASFSIRPRDRAGTYNKLWDTWLLHRVDGQHADGVDRQLIDILTCHSCLASPQIGGRRKSALTYLVLAVKHGAEERRPDHRKAMRTSSARLPVGSSWSYSVSSRAVQSRR
jgi:hypothetical protein